MLLKVDWAAVVLPKIGWAALVLPNIGWAAVVLPKSGGVAAAPNMGLLVGVPPNTGVTDAVVPKLVGVGPPKRDLLPKILEVVLGGVANMLPVLLRVLGVVNNVFNEGESAAVVATGCC